MSKIQVVAAPSRTMQIREKLTQMAADIRDVTPIDMTVYYLPLCKEFRICDGRGKILYRLKFVEQHQDGGLVEKFSAWALRYNKVVYIGAGAEKCISRLGVAARATFVPFEDFVKG